MAADRHACMWLCSDALLAARLKSQIRACVEDARERGTRPVRCIVIDGVQRLICEDACERQVHEELIRENTDHPPGARIEPKDDR
jgi:hypothetical protein